MTGSINNQKQSIPAYSGITINITNPTLNAAPLSNSCSPNCTAYNHQTPSFTVEQGQNPSANKLNNAIQYGVTNPNSQVQNYSREESIQNTTQRDFNTQDSNTQTKNIEKSSDVTNNSVNNKNNSTNTKEEIIKSSEGLPQAYPPQYYLNNYNYIQNGEKAQAQPQKNGVISNNTPITTPQAQSAENPSPQYHQAQEIQEEDMSSSKEIISELDSRVAEQKELEKNGKKTKIVALTNEYIMSLENYLNNPNTEIRLMAAKEILTRLDEDKERHDDAALNALLNKMLQDPEKLVRIAALSAFSSQLASGNDFTVKLLTKIQNNPNGDKEDALQAADSLLKMSTRTEIRYTPVKNTPTIQQVEQQ